jgi:tetratricopeptide (TPR) repeat protein
LRDLPLQGVRDRLSQRWRKWRKRRPMSLPMFALALSFALAASIAGFGLFDANEDRHRQAEASLLEGQEWQRKGQHQAAVSSFLKGKELAEQSFGGRHLQVTLARRLRLAQRLQHADELAKIVHLLRFYALQEHTPRRMRHVLEAGGRTIWAERGLLMDTGAGEWENHVEQQIRANLHEFVHLWTDLQIRLAPPTHLHLVRDEVKETLIDAERLFGPSLGLSLAQQQHGMPRGERLEPQAAWEFCALARLALMKSDLVDADRQVRQAMELDPLGLSTNFYLGVVMMRRQKHQEASRAFSFCLGLDPCAECYLLRAESLVALEDAKQALADLDFAIERSPAFAFAYQQRGQLHHRLGNEDAARADLEMARKLQD